MPPFLDQYPAFREALTKTESEEEYLAALWALDQLPPLLEPMPRPWTVVTYEALVLFPEETLHNIFRKWNLDVDMEGALSRLGKPSSVVNLGRVSGINGWKKQLTEQQVSRILATVHAFGLRFYGRSEEPNYAELNSPALPDYIRRIGAGNSNVAEQPLPKTTAQCLGIGKSENAKAHYQQA